MEDPNFEPVTKEHPDRHLPIMEKLMRRELWDEYKTMEALTWTAQEADFQNDYCDWDTKMTPGDRAYYKHIFALFGPADEKIMRNIAERFTSEFAWTEIMYFYRQQAQNEGVHSESYAQQIGALFKGEELTEMCAAVDHMPVVRKLMGWVDNWIGADETLGTRVAAFAFFEGVLFQGMFMSLQLLKERNLLSGVTLYNELISRDEGRHCLYACLLLNKYIRNRPEQAKVHQVLSELMVLIDEFFVTAVNAAKAAEGLDAKAPCPVKFITLDKMHQYVRFVADTVLGDMGYDPLYRVPANPYSEASKLSQNRVLKVNFFEHVPTQYSMNVNTEFAALPERCGAVGFGVTR